MAQRYGLAALAALAALATAPPAAAAPPDRAVTITPANNASNPARWDSPVRSGDNQNYDSESGSPCDDTAAHYCDDTLLTVSLPEGFRGNVRVDISNFRPNPASDFDLYVYESNAAGDRGRLLANAGRQALIFFSAGLPYGAPEFYIFPAEPKHYLVRVVYWHVPVPSQFSAAAQIANLVPRNPSPPDVDQPRGL